MSAKDVAPAVGLIAEIGRAVVDVVRKLTGRKPKRTKRVDAPPVTADDLKARPSNATIITLEGKRREL